MNARPIFVVTITACLLSACAASYKTPDELRSQGKYKISATIEAEHVKLYTEVLEQFRLCWGYSAGVGSFRVNNDFLGATSHISTGLYSLATPKIFYIIDMSATQTKTDVVVTGVNSERVEKIVDGMKLFAAGKPTLHQWCKD